MTNDREEIWEHNSRSRKNDFHITLHFHFSPCTMSLTWRWFCLWSFQDHILFFHDFLNLFEAANVVDLTILREFMLSHNLSPKVSSKISVLFISVMRSFDSLLNSLISLVCLSLEGRILPSGGSRTSRSTVWLCLYDVCHAVHLQEEIHQ